MNCYVGSSPFRCCCRRDGSLWLRSGAAGGSRSGGRLLYSGWSQRGGRLVSRGGIARARGEALEEARVGTWELICRQGGRRGGGVWREG